MLRKFAFAAVAALILMGDSCDPNQTPTADQMERAKQERLTAEASREVDLPNITQFQEKRTLKLVEELADRAIPTYSYHFNPFQGCYVPIGVTYGYPIPYATQYTNPQKKVRADLGANYGDLVMANADPNGLFKPATADGTWFLMKNPVTGQLEPQYSEDKVETFTFRHPNECKLTSAQAPGK